MRFLAGRLGLGIEEGLPVRLDGEGERPRRRGSHVEAEDIFAALAQSDAPQLRAHGIRGGAAGDGVDPKALVIADIARGVRAVALGELVVRVGGDVKAELRGLAPEHLTELVREDIGAVLLGLGGRVPVGADAVGHGVGAGEVAEDGGVLVRGLELRDGLLDQGVDLLAAHGADRADDRGVRAARVDGLEERDIALDELGIARVRVGGDVVDVVRAEVDDDGVERPHGKIPFIAIKIELAVDVIAVRDEGLGVLGAVRGVAGDDAVAGIAAGLIVRAELGGGEVGIGLGEVLGAGLEALALGALDAVGTGDGVADKADA